MKKLLYLSMAVFILACATKKTETPPPPPSPTTSLPKPSAPAPSTITADNFKSNDPNYAYADFTKGKMLYETKCNKCHPLKPIFSQNYDGWNKYVPDMVAKYNRNFSDLLDERAEELIKAYLLTELEQGKNK
jgi:hypothetical protein